MIRMDKAASELGVVNEVDCNNQNKPVMSSCVLSYCAYIKDGLDGLFSQPDDPNSITKFDEGLFIQGPFTTSQNIICCQYR